MAFDRATRNRLRVWSARQRSLLSEELNRQLQQQFGLDPQTGEAADVARLDHLDDAPLETARVLQQIFAQYLASDKASSAVTERRVPDRMVREQDFTVVNHLAALHMVGMRGLLVESVANGYHGFQAHARLADA